MKQMTTHFRRTPAPCRSFCLAIVAALGWLGHGPASGATTTSPETLIGTAQGFLEFTVEDYLQRSGIEGRYEVEVNRLDPRLRLAECDSDLTASLESPATPIGRVTVRVRCDGSSPWTVFVPAQVRLFRDVLVTVRPLKRGEVVGMQDLTLLERDVGLLGQGFLTAPEQAAGKTVTRPLLADQVLTPTHLQSSRVVRKGDQVLISANSGKVSVHMNGEALGDGAEGQQVRVRNLSSQRIIKARVAGPGLVKVDL
ncbi:flagellar basal body P-ring formation chaperone FlgA [Zestomonas thermotolerans]|uniref:flagellar basal body P-ring formation chaperone FlgA n=1 Tax=Zestomonas thermotolerans TaxID=157784 RepID=UPI0023F3FC8C|nr:flagellar basal body P-ring formation chaperone FlgA [Pseudomonas thermotolerans]